MDASFSEISDDKGNQIVCKLAMVKFIGMDGFEQNIVGWVVVSIVVIENRIKFNNQKLFVLPD